ncbi:MAG: DUF29 domain-containing protein [Pseudanabaenaceae cyanobacterium SKYGB_i_bin29]|nr:DUF29 domain-containing protein [Pseudanabaenaceae cyanobacterium SKYG29]MDW8420402.1 DUF29 domain-containing protein [Pseudanabaenaceae cyanobacterium SKYGB_i_bin29]
MGETRQTLYDRDFALWVEDTVAKLQNQDFSHLDLGNLIEEVASLGKRDRRELLNRMTTLLEHLLKLRYVDLPECCNGWRVTIKRTQRKLYLLLQDSPSLRNFARENILECYQVALSIVKQAYPSVNFPPDCPFPPDIDLLITEN